MQRSELTKYSAGSQNYKVTARSAGCRTPHAGGVCPPKPTASFQISESNLVFLFLGLIRPYKGVEELVDAFRRCDAPHARLVIAGRPVDESMRRKVANAIAGDARIQFYPGFVKDDEVQNYMNASDVVVLPYRRILTSGAAVLAMSFGKPCIAPRAGCITDALDENGAFFFDPQAGGDLENALRHAMVCQKKLPMMGRHNLDKVTCWNWEKIGRETAGVYRTPEL